MHRDDAILLWPEFWLISRIHNTDCEPHSEWNFNWIVKSPTVRHSGHSSFRLYFCSVFHPLPTPESRCVAFLVFVWHSGHSAFSPMPNTWAEHSVFQPFGIPGVWHYGLTFVRHSSCSAFCSLPGANVTLWHELLTLTLKPSLNLNTIPNCNPTYRATPNPKTRF